jgi:hypothetical protein
MGGIYYKIAGMPSRGRERLPADVTLNLDASTQDTYLYLLTGNDKQGAVITSNDDSNGTSNSQITRSLAAGTYTLEATTYLAGRTGAFSVQVH